MHANSSAVSATSSSAGNPLAPEWLRVPTPDLNVLDAGVWSTNAVRNTGGDDRAQLGELCIGGVPATELVSTFGSPCYVIDEDDARTRASDVRSAFQEAFGRIGAEVELHYASKALLTVEIAKWMVAAGLGLDVASVGELEVGLAAGVAPASIGMHGNNKTDETLRRAIDVGVGSIIIDSLQEVARIERIATELGRVQPVLVRINSGIHASTHDFLATSHEDQKFGLTFDAAREAIRRIRTSAALEFLGLHSHIGSGIYEPAGFGAAAARLMQFRAELLADGPVPEVNLGGGFGVAYLPSDAAPSINVLANGIAQEVQRVCRTTGSELPRFVFEPGRSVIGPAGTTLYRVGTTKTVQVTCDDGQTAPRCYVSVDGGMGDNLRPAIYGAQYTVRLANRSSDAAAQLVRVVGSHCESGDVVIHNDYLPADVEPGDLLAVPVTGAYCFSMASNYNYTPRPAMVAVSNGTSRLLVRRVEVEDLLSYDASWTKSEGRDS